MSKKKREHVTLERVSDRQREREWQQPRGGARPGAHVKRKQIRRPGGR
ncbi:MAG: hypothetical protein JXB35_07680 [Anaerolineae bacterium]|nr:hypothetical protein [Anaerolineae bacterium]